MTHYLEEILICPYCNAEVDYKIWHTLDHLDDPQLIEDCMSGRLFQCECHLCSNTFLVPRHFTFKHHPLQTIVHWATNPADLAMTENMIDLGYLSDGELSPQVQHHRIVTDVAALSEKITILEAGLDDRVIELMKYMIIDKAKGYFDLTYDHLRFHVDDGQIHFTFFNQQRQVHQVPFSLQFYQKIHLAFQQLMDQKESTRIDQDWAKVCYQELDLNKGGKNG